MYINPYRVNGLQYVVVLCLLFLIGIGVRADIDLSLSHTEVTKSSNEALLGTPVTPCIAPDNGFGTVDLPAACVYVSTDGTMEISNGFPAGTTIDIDATLENFLNIVRFSGGTLGGEVQQYDATLKLPMIGSGLLVGYSRLIQMPVVVETHSASRTSGLVQTFNTDMVQMQGEVLGDPDFSVLRVRAGTNLGLPSPGVTTLTNSGGNWNVDSFFDVYYEIEFVGAPGSMLDGFSGTTQGTVRMQQGGAYWQPGDDHKMHFPQLPDEAGWDAQATMPVILADDWQCSETGWVKDIHFWGSWMHGITGEIESFTLSIHSDIPSGGTSDYSRPGNLLWERTIQNFTYRLILPPTMEGWYDPTTDIFFPGDHQEYFQYDIILDQPDWFFQDEGTIYWLNITAQVLDPVATSWGWKSSLDHYNDNAVFGIATSPCVAPDNGSGTADLPAQCPYVSPNDTMEIIGGMPPGTEILIQPTLEQFININSGPGGNLGGEFENFQATMRLQMTGTGSLAGFNRTILMPMNVETHSGPRTPGDPVQTFPTDMFLLQGSILGDPDFDQLQINAGTSLGFPSPGQTTLTQDGGNWNVDSFFDITYSISFVGAPGSILDGLSGGNQGVVGMQQGGTVQGPWQELFEPPDFSLPLDLAFVITGGCCVNRGNIDNIIGPGGPIDVNDLTFLVAYLFQGGGIPPCLEEANVDGVIGPAGPIDVSDLTYLVAYLFQGGPPPPAC